VHLQVFFFPPVFFFDTLRETSSDSRVSSHNISSSSVSMLSIKCWYKLFCAYICIHVYLYVYIYIYMYMCIYICLHIYIYVYIYMYTYIHLYMYTYLHLYMYIYICIYTYVYVCRGSFQMRVVILGAFLRIYRAPLRIHRALFADSQGSFGRFIGLHSIPSSSVSMLHKCWCKLFCVYICIHIYIYAYIYIYIYMYMYVHIYMP